MKRKFFLGGIDPEMEEINTYLQSKGALISNKNLSWNDAKASHYKEEIMEALSAGLTPVLVELKIDFDLLKGVNVEIVNHHDDDSDKPASILQVVEIFGDSPTWNQKVIAAYDSQGFFGLKEVGASDAEIMALQEKGYDLRGISEEMRMISVECAKDAIGKHNVEEILVVKLPFNSFGVAKDYLWNCGYLEVIFMDESGSEVEYQGEGVVTKKLEDHYQANGFTCWSGGQGKGQAGRFDSFFGCYGVTPEELKEVILN